MDWYVFLCFNGMEVVMYKFLLVFGCVGFVGCVLVLVMFIEIVVMCVFLIEFG